MLAATSSSSRLVQPRKTRDAYLHNTRGQLEQEITNDYDDLDEFYSDDDGEELARLTGDAKLRSMCITSEVDQENYRLARQCAENGDTENALHYYEELIEASLNPKPLVLEYALLCAEGGRENIAVDLYEGILSLSPRDKASLHRYSMLLCDLAENQGDVKFANRAIELLSAIAKKNTSNRNKKQEALIAQAAEDLVHVLKIKQLVQSQRKKPSIKSRRTLGPISAPWANPKSLTEPSSADSEESKKTTGPRRRKSNKKDKQLCPVCEKPIQFTCSQCRVVAYCGRDCQVKDWKTHKSVCAKFRKYSDALKDDETKEKVIAQQDQSTYANQVKDILTSTSGFNKGKLRTESSLETLLYFGIMILLATLFGYLLFSNLNSSLS